jgi:hypothetical protein
MRMIRVILFALLISQVVFGQSEAVKVNEFFSSGGGCDNYFRYANFRDELLKDDGNRGLVVIYTGDKKERFGNLLAYKTSAIVGVEEWLGVPKGRFSTIILEGKSFFAQEFWIIPKGAESPYSKSYEFDWSKINDKYYFGVTCLSCEGDYPFWTSSQAGFNEYAKILNQFPNYKGQIIVNNYSELEIVKQKFTKEAKLPRNRYKIRFRKVVQNNAMFHLVDFYIVPKQSKLK